MASKPFVMDLAKLVIAAAWADGELAQHEDAKLTIPREDRRGL